MSNGPLLSEVILPQPPRVTDEQTSRKTRRGGNMFFFNTPKGEDWGDRYWTDSIRKFGAMILFVGGKIKDRKVVR